jgi:uncharacterized membrane protein YcaP (DUF421 family)
MDPLRIVVRVVFAYLVVLVFLRLTGKRAVKHASPFDFVVALILGDLIDDALWAEVNASTFVVASGALFFVHTAFDLARYRSGLAR